MKEKLKKHKKLLIILGILLLFIILLIQGINSKKEALMGQMPLQEKAQIEKRSLVESVSATGTVTSIESKSVKADVNGRRVTTVNVKVGDAVEKGDVLCTLDSQDIEADLKDANTSLNAVNAKTGIDLTAAERNLSEAEAARNIDLERANQDVADAWNDYLAAITDMEEAENRYDSAVSAAASNKKEYEARQEEVKKAKADMDAAASAGEDAAKQEEEFENKVEALGKYLEEKSIDTSTISGISLSGDLTGFTGENIASSYAGSDSTAVIAEVNTLLEGLKELQVAYNNAIDSGKDYEKKKEVYEALLNETNEWQAKYSTAQNNVNTQKTAYEQAQSTVDSRLDTYNKQVRSKEDTVRSGESTISSKKDNLATTKLNASTSGQSDEKQIRSYKKQLEECTVTAPINGVVTALNVEEGAFYSGAEIATIEDNSTYEISAEIDEYNINKIEVGQKVVIKTNGTGDKEFDGTVKEIAPRATGGNSGGVTYKVTVSINEDCEELRLDMTAKLSIILESRENVLTVPYDAVQEDDKGYFVEVMKEEVLEKIYVTKGIESDYYIEISGDGIKEGMMVLMPSADNGTDMEKMLRSMGPMGGF